ncbi:MAG: hypothetical protein GWP05_02325 [Anaerolineaceae bacterium]|nr:hypothetical protein [Anaerolineaceae bacterium]
MKPRTIITVALLAFVAVSVAAAILRESRGRDDQPLVEPDGFVVYYFHGPQRCRTCLTIQSCWREAVDEGFPEAIRDGRLRRQAINFLAPESARFVPRYRIESLSIVVAEVRNGRPRRQKNLGAIWDYRDDRPGMVEYIRSQVAAFMEGK